MKDKIMHFPIELPLAEAKNLFDFVRGNPNNLTKSVVIESGWWVVGYGLSMTIAAEPGFIMSSAYSANELEAHLQGIIEGGENEGFQKLDWNKIIQAILAALKVWMGQ